jgi:hypothetical protein
MDSSFSDSNHNSNNSETLETNHDVNENLKLPPITTLLNTHHVRIGNSSYYGSDNGRRNVYRVTEVLSDNDYVVALCIYPPGFPESIIVLNDLVHIHTLIDV